MVPSSVGVPGHQTEWGTPPSTLSALPTEQRTAPDESDSDSQFWSYLQSWDRVDFWLELSFMMLGGGGSGRWELHKVAPAQALAHRLLFL